jgi:hypothetical protein
MAVYQSGTEPIVRRRELNHVIPRLMLRHEDRAVALRLRGQYGIPRKAEWTVEEDDFGRVFRFRWFEVETNA